MSKQTVIAAIASIAATAGLCAMTPPSFAAEPDKGDTITVRYADLDLKTVEGKAELDRRIERAARTVCGMGPEATTGTRIQSQTRMVCYRNALRQIEPQFARLIDSSGGGA